MFFLIYMMLYEKKDSRDRQLEIRLKLIINKEIIYEVTENKKEYSVKNNFLINFIGKIC